MRSSTSSRRKTIVSVILGGRFVKTTGVRKLVEANREAGTRLNFITTRDVDYRRRRVWGTYYDRRTDRWRSKYFPMPHVLYVRGGSGRGVRRIAYRFDREGIPRINSLIAFDKGELFDKLSRDETVKQYLPFTKIVDNWKTARRYIRSMGNVYIKACHGRRGMQVIQVSKVKHRGYLYRHSHLGSLVRNRAEHFKDMERVLRRYFGSRRVIIQQAIDTVKTSQNHAVDFRGEVQRNGSGDIEITAIPIRVGRKNSPISTHGDAYKFHDYLPKLFPHYSEDRLEELKDRIRDFLIKIYTSVERCYGRFGEIGVDFGVDRNGNIWLIECNAQSAKVSVGKAYGSRTIRKLYLNPLEYAKRLARRRR